MAPQDSFLARQTFGLPRWVWVAMAALFVLAFVPRGVRLALEGTGNRAKDWLPASYPESVDLAWFTQHFSSAQFVLVSWEGCTLADTNGRLQLLSEKLAREVDDRGQPVFKEILTGPQMVEKLTKAPSNLSTPAAVSRLEGALVGPEVLDAQGEVLPSTLRTTCMVAYMSPHITSSNRRMRDAISRIEQLATEQCGVPLAELRMAGPPVDNVTIDYQGSRSLRKLALFAGLIGLGIAYWSFRSWKLTLSVFAVAAMAAGASLSAVYWLGLIEVGLFGMATPRLGKMDAILNSMPAVVYVLGLSGAIHVVNYYRDERSERGAQGAAERGVRISWGPCLLAAVTTAVGLASLGVSDIVPVEKFGVMTAFGVLMTFVILFTVLPILLHLLADSRLPERAGGPHGAALPGWATRLFEGVTRRHAMVSIAGVMLIAVAAAGLPRIESSVELLKLLDDEVDLIHDYAWLEQNLGNLVPVEVVVALTPDQQRLPDDLAETPTVDHYRMTMVERMQMSHRIQERIESIDSVSRALSAASFGPPPASRGGSRASRRAANYTTSIALEEPASRAALVDYVRSEITPEAEQASPRELWRVSARVAALKGVDYGEFLGELQTEVEPVLAAYRARDGLIAELHKRGASLADARVTVAFHAPEGDSAAQRSAAVELYRLLRESDTRRPAAALNTAKIAQAPERSLQRYREVGLIVTLNDNTSRELLADAGFTNVVSLTEVPNLVAGQSRNPTTSFASTYTGIVPLVYKTQGELIHSLQESIAGATLLIGFVMVVLLRNPAAGLVSMLPNVFPIVMVFGGLGWLGVKVDIGIMMTASVALGVAVDDTIHFLTWFRRGIAEGLDRRRATMLAYDRCAIAMTQTTLVAGLGLMVFMTGTFTPSQQFGAMMVTMLTAALVGDLLLLPALLCGPLGWFFAPSAPATADSAMLQTQHNEPALAGEQTPDEPALAGQLLSDATSTEETSISEAPADENADGTADVIPFPTHVAEAHTAIESAADQTPPPPHSPASEDRESLSPEHAALRNKLRRFRRG